MLKKIYINEETEKEIEFLAYRWKKKKVIPLGLKTNYKTHVARIAIKAIYIAEKEGIASIAMGRILYSICTELVKKKLIRKEYGR